MPGTAYTTRARWIPPDAPKVPVRVSERLRSRDLAHKLGTELMATFQDNIRAGGRPNKWPKVRKTSGRPGYVAGQMMRGFGVRARSGEVEVFNRAGHAAPFHFGAMGSHAVVPVFRRYLAVPLTPIAARRKPRQVPGLFVIKSKKGKLFLVKRKGRDKLEFWYRLMSKVQRPPRPVANVPPGIKDTLDRRVMRYGLEGVWR